MSLATLFRTGRYGLALAGLLLLGGCRNDLLTDLTERQANETVAVLQRHQVPAHKEAMGKKRFRVEVEEAAFAQAAALLDAYGLPSREDQPISALFPMDSLVNSPTAERARLISGLEERLAQTIDRIGGAFGARVHASYPIMARDNGATAPMHLAIVVNYDGENEDGLFAEQLKQLAKNSFESLSYDNISVVLFRGMRPDFPVLLVESPWGGRFAAAAAALIIVLCGAGAALAWRWRRRAPLATQGKPS